MNMKFVITLLSGLLVSVNAIQKNNCVPETKFDIGTACTFAFQCELNFCCPYERMCMVNSGTGVDSSVMKEKNDSAHYDVLKGTVCVSDDQDSCLFYDGGTVPPGFDQSKCGCAEAYMNMYKSCSWAGGGKVICKGTDASPQNCDTQPNSGDNNNDNSNSGSEATDKMIKGTITMTVESYEEDTFLLAVKRQLAAVLGVSTKQIDVATKNRRLLESSTSSRKGRLLATDVIITYTVKKITQTIASKIKLVLTNATFKTDFKTKMKKVEGITVVVSDVALLSPVESAKSLSTGAIIGIAVGVVIFIAGVVFALIKLKRRASQTGSTSVLRAEPQRLEVQQNQQESTAEGR